MFCTEYLITYFRHMTVSKHLMLKATDTRAIFLSRWQRNFCKIIALPSQEVATRATECATLPHNPRISLAGEEV